MRFFLLLTLLSSVLWSRNLDSALQSDPYFAQKLKMQLVENRYAEEKAKYLERQRAKKAKLSSSKKLTPDQLKKLRYKKKNQTPTLSYNSSTRWVGPVKHSRFKFRVKQLGFKVKYDVRFDGMDPKWYNFLPKIRNAFGSFVPWVTSGTDGRHHKQGKYSHYTGHKIDIRVKNMPGVRIRGKRITVGKAIVKDYVRKLNAIEGIKAVLEEGTTYPHIDILVEY